MQFNSLKEPRVVIIAPGIPPDFGGGGIRAMRQAAWLDSIGWDMGVLTRTENPNSIGSVQIFSTPIYPGTASGMIQQVGSLWDIRRFLSEFRPDIVHAVSCTSWSMASLKVAQSMGFATIAEMTLLGSDDVYTISQAKFGRIQKRTVLSCDAVVSISPALHDVALRQGVSAARARIIGNGVDVERYRPVNAQEKRELRSSLGLSQSGPIICSVGVIRPRKGMMDVLEIFRELANEFKDAQLVICGPTKKDEENRRHTNELKGRINAYGLNERVLLVGEVAEVDLWLKASDVFLFMSKAEGFGTALIEAASVGIPVVAKSLPGITDYIFGNQYPLVEDNLQALLQVRRILSCPKSWEKQKYDALERIQEKFGFNQIMGMYVDLYREVQRN